MRAQSALGSALLFLPDVRGGSFGTRAAPAAVGQSVRQVRDDGDPVDSSVCLRILPETTLLVIRLGFYEKVAEWTRPSSAPGRTRTAN